MEVRRLPSEQVVKYEEHCLTCEEIVIVYSHYSYHYSKNAFTLIIYGFLHSYQHQREKCGNVLEVVEEDVVSLKT